MHPRRNGPPRLPRSLLALLLAAAALAGGGAAAAPAPAPTEAAAYRGTRKIVVSAGDAAARGLARGLAPRRVLTYPDREVYIVDASRLAALAPALRAGLQVRDDLDRISLRGRTLVTTAALPPVPAPLALTPGPGPQLHLVQFAGPIQRGWPALLEQQGSVQIITYLANDAYLVYADGAAAAHIAELVAQAGDLQLVAPFHPAYRIHPALNPGGAGEVEVTIQLVEHDGVSASVEAIEQVARTRLRPPWRVGPYRNLRVRIPESEIAAIARLDDVVGIAPWIEPHPTGERQGQICAGHLDGSGTQPVGPGYLAWLEGLGFGADFGFAVNLSDSGFDRGQTAAASIHPDFRDSLGASRIAYVQRVSGTTIDTSAAANVDSDGHGTINHSIVGGRNAGAGSAYTDAGGYHYGLGIAPFAKLGSSRIFAPNFTNPDETELSNAAWVKGARISSNSWDASCSPNGCCPAGQLGDYDADSQEFDALTRDARPAGALDGGEAGNQEMLIVFAAGNQGTCSREQLGNEGATAKNTLVVGAGESYDPSGTDGCGVGNSGANSAADVASFSSHGPTNDGRVKPDLMAPGTHIHGAASQYSGYDGSGVCNQYFPSGQTLYALSSGTSHSTPAVAGGAALVRQWLLDHGHPAPSPALIKAYLMGSATRMTGAGANDTLPSDAQGMGRMSLGRSFDAAARILVDETQILDATGATWSVSGAIVDPILPFRVTLAFTDVPGPTVGDAWVNDLDLEVRVDSGSGPVLYRGNHFSGGLSVAGGTADPRNNVESVWLPAGTTGTFTVTVRAQNIAGDGVPGVGDGLDQDFALVVYNGSDAVCGNGAVEFGEACDDGNTVSGDGCSDACQVEGGFTCSGAPSACGAVCGDGLVLGAESCDDGNTASGDGCSDTCQVEGGFTCGGAPSACGAVCGDGLVLGAESCDDGNTVSGDGCSGACQVEGGYTCAGAPSACGAVCGDGLVLGAESCDDGNAASGDGCSGACAVEPGFACSGQPSLCEVAPVPAASSAARELLALLLLSAGACVLARQPRTT